MILGIDINFWYGMAVVAALTLAGVLVAWCLPPKKEASNGNGVQQLKEEKK